MSLAMLRILLWAALALLPACAGGIPPAPTRAELLALSGVRAPTDPRYLDLLDQARRDGATITPAQMIALRWAWMRSTDFDPVMPTLLARRAQVRAGTDCARAKQAAAAVLDIHWLDLRAHATLLACARRDGDQPAEARHLAIRDAILAAIRASGDGSGPDKALTTISVDEEYALLEVLRARRTGLSLTTRNAARFDVMTAEEVEGGRAFVLWFNVEPLFQWYERHATSPLRT